MKTKDIVNISMFATLLAVCAWICIPMAVPFTLQTFAVFLAMMVLGGKQGIIVICIYLFLGMIGIPVFSGGTAGIGVILGNTGGYMMGWFFLGLIMMAAEKLTERFEKNKKLIQVVGMVLGLLACYGFGTLWFMQVYARNTGEVGFMAALGMCVVPFVIPDIVKMILAFVVSKRIKKVVKNV